jgi:serine/threonine protein kinase
MLEGQTIGRYVVQGVLGRGALGTVYKGVDPWNGKVVAIKVLSRRSSVDPEMVSRFVAEARAVSRIRDRHILDIFSLGQLDDGRHYYVMEYLEGETLKALLEVAALQHGAERAGAIPTTTATSSDDGPRESRIQQLLFIASLAAITAIIAAAIALYP